MAKKPVRTDRSQAITDTIYELAKGRGYDVSGLYPATLRRIRELIEYTKDPDQVELVARYALDADRHEFVAYKSLALNHFEMLRDKLEVPDGAWSYALLLETAAPQRRDAIDYWLREWRDGELAGDDVMVFNATKKLELLRERDEEERAALDTAL